MDDAQQDTGQNVRASRIHWLVNFKIPKITRVPSPPRPRGPEPGGDARAELHTQAIAANDAARDGYRAELSALGDEELAYRYHAARLQSEGLTALTNFNHWLAKDEWTWTDAAHILTGFQPRLWMHFDPTDKDTQPQDSGRWKIAEMYDFIKGACYTNKLDWRKAPVIPLPNGTKSSQMRCNRVTHVSQLVTWARAKSALLDWLKIPPEIDAAFPPKAADAAIPAIPANLSAATIPQPRYSQSSAPRWSGLRPLSHKLIATYFRYPGLPIKRPERKKDDVADPENAAKWQQACSEPSPDRYNLLPARQVPSKGGRTAALFDPLRITEWIIGRNADEARAAAKSLLDVIDDQDDPARFKALQEKWAPVAE